jgi:DNA-binding CsgD family transcriptional regulator
MGHRFCYLLGVRTAAVFAFLILSALGILAVLWAHGLFRTYRQRFLQPYMLHVAFWAAHALVQITQYILGSVFLAGGTSESLAPALWPLFILLMGLSLFFLLVMTGELRGRPLPFAARVVYPALWAALVAAYAVFLGRPAPASPAGPEGPLPLLSALLKNGTILGSMAWLVFPAGRAKDDPLERRFRRRFAGLYLTGYALFQLSAVGIIPLSGLPWDDYLIALLQLGFQFPPLLILSVFLKQRAVDRPPFVAWPDLRQRLAPLGLSPREAEIVGLVLRGYSNREIEKSLFISLETVKKHVSNVYRKLGVKNRVQLSNLVQNRCRIEPEDVPPPG